MTQLASTVYVQDPETHQTVRLEPGTNPPSRLAALVTNPAAWVDGKLPTAAKKAQAGDGDQGNGQGDGSGGASDSDADTEGTKPVAAKKAAATRPARGRRSADEGGS
ncbi:hypothetical protein SSOG_09187 [Streptomyces himastatinicus ATCC 53653]|uniref:Uncharacterized protein n=1 Tax=Streptomyces himastatinicus ATCC 53653 TaxID=457427 RepID=D9WX45_9ACTN|nr:hypothetical protein [Streptomyces himastatinicus]EFL29473.1 hypothetical protein SSOG_09187 [Streptomyces himastatinicus ATCC 53653]